MSSRALIIPTLLTGVALALAASGCSIGDNGSSKTLATVTETTTVFWDGLAPAPADAPDGGAGTPAVPTSQPDETQAAVVGQPFSVVCHHSRPCDSVLTITSLTVGEPCEFGVNTYFGTERQESFKKKPGEAYLQVHAEYDLRSAPSGWRTLDDPEVVNAEGFTQTPGPNVECLDSTDGEGNWGTTINDGEKKRVYDTWVIPEGATAFTLEDHRIELPS